MEEKKKRKCLKEITNTKNYKDIEYGYVVDDDELIELDLVDSEEFYKDFYITLIEEK